MTKGFADDRRFMSSQAEGRRGRTERFIKRISKDTPAHRTCFCGKTVVEANGIPTGATCPRQCERSGRQDMKSYGVNTQDGFAQDFEATDDDAAEVEARRILVEEQAKSPGTRFEVWDTATDMLVSEGIVRVNTPRAGRGAQKEPVRRGIGSTLEFGRCRGQARIQRCAHRPRLPHRCSR